MFVFIRLFYVQVIWGKDLQIKALDQWTRNVPVLAKRGEIVDRNGVVLATSKKTYTIFVRPRAVTKLDETVAVLSEIFNLNEQELKQKITTTKVSEIKIAKHVGKEYIDKLSNYSLSGVYFAEDVTRYYPYDSLLAQVLGYTSADGNGISGLEYYYNTQLSGTNGEILYEADLTGVDIKNKAPSYVPAVNGLNLKLTIDYEVQQILEAITDEAMSEYTPKSASAIVINPQSGEVLGMAMKPSLNLNNVPLGDLETLNKLGRITLVADCYEPGSTFKVLTASANVNELLKGNKNAYSLEHVYSSSRYRYVEGSKIKCWSTHEKGKHANETLADALNNSCNPIFVDIALALGKDNFYSYLNSFGYGKVTGIDLPGEAQGMLLPKSAVLNADLARISFGQAIAVTPIQLVTATASAINGGKLITPYLVKEVYSSGGTLSLKTETKQTGTTVSAQTSKIISSYLEGVVSNGSGKQAYIEGYKVGGKTGTAQKYQNGVISQGKYVMSFIGFFPADNPEYLCLVIVDEPVGGTYGSTVAAPLCKKVFESIIKVKGL
ncbi:MAG: stage V sporulation protein D [Clostridia bacterium]|nr:stage V sporulation protein D [Clostridia bacterium]